MLLLFAVSGYFATGFRLDASADALMLENDKDLRYFREIAEKYSTQDFLFLTYRPREHQLISHKTFADLKSLKEKLQQRVPALDSVFTMVDAPLLNSPRVGISDLAQGLPTVLSKTTDLDLATIELSQGDVYGNNLVSPDAKVTAMLLTFKNDAKLNRLLKERNDLRLLRQRQKLSTAQQQQLDTISQEYRQYLAQFNDQRSADVLTIRNTMDEYRSDAQLFLGGASMIASDMVDFIKKDLLVFGLGVLLLLLATLALIFRSLRWVVLPLGICAATALVTTGILGVLDWPVTVISSNYLSLLLIINLSMTIHLIVRFRLIQTNQPQLSHYQLVRRAVSEMAMPCFYMAATTIVAFGSLVVSGIRPVIDFGYMMMCAVAVAYVLSFTLFPLVLLWFDKPKARENFDMTKKITMSMAKATLKYGNAITVVAAILAVFTAWGFSLLEVENRFIDYFKSDTEIHQGMLLIDQKLGGTTPLDVVIDAPESFFATLNAQELASDESQPSTDEEDDWLYDVYQEQDSSQEINYWYNPKQLQRLEQVHDFLEQQPEIGKVSSLATAMKVVRMVNNDQPLGDFELAILRKNMPQALDVNFVKPFLAADANQVRLSMRVIDSNHDLRRNELIKRLQAEITTKFDFEPEQVKMTGLLVLYNNMLQSLFSSQIMTLGAVVFAIFLMFIALFRSVYVSLVTIVPNILAATIVLGLIGWLKVPLDLMTITIAAITVGMAVDDAIHYVYNFKYSLQQNGGDYKLAVTQAHSSVGRAMYYTSITVIMGFSVLMLSNFMPSVYFGFLAGLAMLAALASNLLLLPRLIVIFKPFARGY